MYNNRLMYKSLQARDNTFYTQILFCIDRALQIHWCSCCECEERDSVNNRVLLMADKRDLIVQHNFNYNIPKALQDKLENLYQNDVDEKDKNQKLFKGKGEKEKDPKGNLKSIKDIIVDNDPKHAAWRLQDGEKFLETLLFQSEEVS